AADDAIDGAQVLHLDHRAHAGLVRAVEPLRDDAVEPGALEALEPVLRQVAVARRRREVRGRADARERALEPRAALREERTAQVVSAVREEVEGDERRGRLRGELANARFRRVDAHLQRIEVEAVVGHDHDLAVEHDRRRQRFDEAARELREVAIQRLQVAALDIDVAVRREDDRAEAVPLRLVEPAVAFRDARFEAREHRLDRRLHRRGHAESIARLEPRIPEGDGWLYEPKWDGFRAVVFASDGDVYIQSRDLKPLYRDFPELARGLVEALPAPIVLDGEVVIMTDHGLDFDALQMRIHP